MKIDVYSSTGSKKGSAELPAALFEAPIDNGLMHLYLVRQQANRRQSPAHKKTRGEIVGSTRKLIKQKGTGRARKGSASANILRGGNKSFAPRNIRNFSKDMPKKMRRRALFSCLSFSAKEGRIIGLEGYGEDAKTKTFNALLQKLPVNIGRKIVLVTPEKMESLERGSRNIPGVKTILAQYLNPEDVLGAHHLIFVGGAVEAAEAIFGKKSQKSQTNQKKKSSESSASSASSPKAKTTPTK